MAATVKQVENLKKKFKSLEIKVVEASEFGKVDVMAITYQRNGLPGKISPGLIEVNALWDERQSRPKGYIVAAAIERSNGIAVSVMVSEEFYRLHKSSFDDKKAEWETAL